MKKYIGITIISIILFGCGSSGNGELVGVQKRSVWNPTTPYGMVYVPQGSYVMGPSDQDVPFANVTSAKTVSVGAFYLDETEITNVCKTDKVNVNKTDNILSFNNDKWSSYD